MTRFGAIVGGLVVLLLGLWIGWDGLRLVALGGSPYYLIAGLGLAATGVLLGLRRTWAGWAYGAVLFGTLIWAIAESGFAFWPLLPRLAGPVVIGGFVCLILLLAPKGAARRQAEMVCGGLSLLCLVVLLASIVPLYSWGQGKAAAAATATATATATGLEPADWRYYGRDAGGARFAPYAQITAANVQTLKLAWTAHTGEVKNRGSEDQNTPMQVGDTLYACTPLDVTVAMDADTGAVKWRHDPRVKPGFWNRCRGVGYYETPAAVAAGPGKPAAPCDRRIINTTIDGRMFALDAATGAECAGFGVAGVVDLKVLMGSILPGFYQPTSMPTVAGDKIIVGGWVTDNVKLDEPSGVVRAFDANTGKLVWAWDIGNPAATGAPPAGYSYTRGTPNVWSTPSFDPKANLVFLPTGNATPDYWGSHRSTQTEKYSSSVVAVDIATGKEVWRYQTVHHDIWDYDVPAQPLLLDFPMGDGKTVPALVILTKRGQIFVLDRATGKPLTQVDEKPVPQGAQRGEWTSPTQPYSTGMPQVGAFKITEAMMWGISPLDQLACRIAFKSVRYDGEFTPPGSAAKPSLQFPGNGGGQNWGSGTWDPQRGLLIMSGVRMAQTVYLSPFTGAPMGKGPMSTIIPGAGPFAPADQRPAQSQGAVRYVSKNTPFVSPIFAPCLQPPHGMITAVDLKTRKIAWEVPAGSAEGEGPLGMASHIPLPIGTVTLGGSTATAGGLVFHASTTDPYLRAYDSGTGKVMWQAKLPVGVGGTPMSFVSPKTGKQYVVVSAGGARIPGAGVDIKGDYVMAFALP